MNEYEATEQAYKNGYRDGLLQGVKDCSAEIKRLKAIEEAHREQNGELRKEVERLTVLAKLGNMRANDYRAMRDKANTARAEAIKEVFEKVKTTTWYHTNAKGELVVGANSETNVPLYKAEDIYKIAKEMGVEL